MRVRQSLSGLTDTLRRSGVMNMAQTTSENDDGGNQPDDRMSDLRAILELTSTARDNAVRLGLKFEAYLLDMSSVALSEQLQKRETGEQ